MMKDSIRAPFPWFCGKGGPKIKEAVLAALPPHARYVKPFGGGASILMAKEAAKNEVYNDVNRGMVRFFRVVASRDLFGLGWLAYCDPPYVLGARKAGGYAHELCDADHAELIATLLRYDGAIVQSGYDSRLYAPLADAGWDRITVDVCCSAAGRTRASGLQGAGSIKTKQRRVERIWRNPEAMRRIAEAGKEHHV